MRAGAGIWDLGFTGLEERSPLVPPPPTLPLSPLFLLSLPPSPFKKELETGWTQDGFMEVECLSVDCHWGHLPPLYKENRKDSELKKTSLNSGNRTMEVYG